jgi:hypothetical protein
MDIGTKIIIWPPIFMVRSCTVFPLGVWTDIICDVFASDEIGASNAAAVSRESKSLTIRIFFSWVRRCFKDFWYTERYRFMAFFCEIRG